MAYPLVARNSFGQQLNFVKGSPQVDPPLPENFLILNPDSKKIYNNLLSSHQNNNRNDDESLQHGRFPGFSNHPIITKSMKSSSNSTNSVSQPSNSNITVSSEPNSSENHQHENNGSLAPKKSNDSVLDKSGSNPSILQQSSKTREKLKLLRGNSYIFNSNIIRALQSWIPLDSSGTRYPFGSSGLPNLGNTCFLNSTLQCLLHTPPLVQYLLSHHYRKTCLNGSKDQRALKLDSLKKQYLLRFKYAKVTKNDDLREKIKLLWLKAKFRLSFPFDPLEELELLADAVSNPSQNDQSTIQSLMSNWFSNISSFGDLHAGYQEDSHEFLSLLLDKLEECFISQLRPVVHIDILNQNVIRHIFSGKVQTRVVCLQCKTVVPTTQVFLSLPLNVFPQISTSLDAFFSTEKLEGENKYQCNTCKSLVNAERTTLLQSPPQVMIFQLKRFIFEAPTQPPESVDNDNQVNNPNPQQNSIFQSQSLLNTSLDFIERKNTDIVEYPVDLDLGKYFVDPKTKAKYTLFAKVLHYGSTSDSGHYTAQAQCPNKQWKNYNDELVSDIPSPNPESTGSSQDYLLFYLLDIDLSSQIEIDIPQKRTLSLRELGAEYMDDPISFTGPSFIDLTTDRYVVDSEVIDVPTEIPDDLVVPSPSVGSVSSAVSSAVSSVVSSVVSAASAVSSAVSPSNPLFGHSTVQNPPAKSTRQISTVKSPLTDQNIVKSDSKPASNLFYNPYSTEATSQNQNSPIQPKINPLKYSSPSPLARKALLSVPKSEISSSYPLIPQLKSSKTRSKFVSPEKTSRAIESARLKRPSPDSDKISYSHLYKSNVGTWGDSKNAQNKFVRKRGYIAPDRDQYEKEYDAPKARKVKKPLDASHNPSKLFQKAYEKRKKQKFYN